ncbi:MAG TPA: aldehyde dehydrogenase family protein [Acidimicrobiales bacterium]|nr:aldehyde dehydrogenase family protein [Acidimicrobiales bacterium]
MWHDDRLLIDGRLVGAVGGATYDTLNPATGDVLGQAADATVTDARHAIDAARRAFDTTDWSRDPAFRARCLRQLHAALVKHEDELRALIVAEVGAPVALTHGPQLAGPIAIVDWYATLLDTFEFTEELGETEVRGAMHRRWVEKEAVGVVAAVVPYNYPVQITLAKLAPALAAGCTVVVKGPPQTPWITAALGKLIAEETDIPAGVVNVLTSSSAAVGELLVTDPAVDMVSFTGSTATGRRIMAAASETVKRVFLELGGKSAFVVLDDAQLELATMFAGFTICSHAGQGCAITSRLLVPEAVFADAAEMVRNTLAGVPYGDPTDPGTMMGPLISAEQRDKVGGMVNAALRDGAKAVIGGGRPEHLPNGYFFEPTLLVDVDQNASIAQDEVFGPVLVMLAYRDDDDAVAIANNSIFGLSAAVFGSDTERATAIARRIRSGTVSINGGMYYGPDAPFGGYKQSGNGREMGVAGLNEYLEQKTLAVPVG